MNMRLESNRQDLASRLVRREIYACVSSLVSTLSDMAQHDSRSWHEKDLSWEEDIRPLLECIDYEEAGTQAINDCDDLGTLESMADGVGYWSDMLETIGYTPSHYDTEISGIETRVAEIDEYETNDPSGELPEGWDDERDTLNERLESLQNEPLQMWLDEDTPTRLDKLHSEIARNTGGWEEFCRENDTDTDDFHSEVYEHWIVSDWLAYKLKNRGYVIGELCGLTIWGRQCTGQSICLDHVIQQIACETWPEEVLHEDVSAGS